MRSLAPSPISQLRFFVLGVLAGLSLLLAVARLVWHSKFYPGVSIGHVDVSGLTREAAEVKVRQATSLYQAQISYNGSSWQAPIGAVVYEIEQSLNEGYHYGRRLAWQDYLLVLLNKKTNYPLKLAEGKTQELEKFISDIASTIEIEPVAAEVSIKDKVVTIAKGSDGILIDQVALDQAWREHYSNLTSEAIAIPTREVKRQLTQEQLGDLQQRAERLIGSTLTLTLDDERIVLRGSELIDWLSTTGEGAVLDTEAVAEYVIGLGESLHKEPQDARFVFENGEVKEFAPGKDGIEVNIQATSTNIQTTIEKLLNEENKHETIEIVVTRTPPAVTTDKVNELGIRERIGRGESYYAHSIANRIYNVGLAASRTQSALIPPGEEYSFNREVGEINGATGYKTAYVISGGRTQLGDGGGVCQVSTTLFRAAMNGGLPIVERWAHAYRVGYYEQNSKPGVDATVYSPSKDLRFKNDTPGHILIQTINDPKTLHLIVEIYGTSDGRVATVSEPKVWGISPPPPDLYQDDPTLPAGVVKQVDWAAWGARTSFEYKVTRDGEILQEKTFTSAYRPWQNVYLRGTMGQ